MKFSVKLLLGLLVFLLMGSGELYAQAFPKVESPASNPRAEGREKKKYNSFRKSRKRSTAFQRKKAALRESQSRVASDFRTNEPAANPDKSRQSQEASRFKGEQPFVSPNPEVVNGQMSKFKGEKVPVPNQSAQEAKSLGMSRYRGNYPMALANRKQVYEATALRQSRFRGPVQVLSPAAKRAGYEATSLQQSRFRGPVQVLSPAAQRGIYERTSLEQSRSLGPVRILSPAAQRSAYEITSLHMSQFKGEKIRIQKIKNAYPTIVYLKAKKKTSFKAKERFRKRMLKKINRNKKKQVPPTQRKIDKNNIPQYDSRENEIWAKPRNADGSERQVTYKKKFSLNPFRKKDKPVQTPPAQELPAQDPPKEEKK